MSGFVQVLITVPKKEDARRIVSTLLDRRLAGCVQVIGPIESAYWWEGKIEEAVEWICLIKSRADLFLELEKAVKGIHPYTVPEILATPIVGGNAGYLDWLGRELRPMST